MTDGLAISRLKTEVDSPGEHHIFPQNGKDVEKKFIFFRQLLPVHQICPMGEPLLPRFEL